MLLYNRFRTIILTSTLNARVNDFERIQCYGCGISVQSMNGNDAVVVKSFNDETPNTHIYTILLSTTTHTLTPVPYSMYFVYVRPQQRRIELVPSERA